jgi:hypothetical protein
LGLEVSKTRGFHAVLRVEQQGNCCRRGCRTGLRSIPTDALQGLERTYLVFLRSMAAILASDLPAECSPASTAIVYACLLPGSRIVDRLIGHAGRGERQPNVG